MANSPKLQQSAAIFTEENISKNTFYILMIVCLGYFMHSQAFFALLGEKSDGTNKLNRDEKYSKPQKVKVVAASMGSMFDNNKRTNNANKSNGAKLPTTNADKTKNISKEEFLNNNKLVISYVKKYAAVAKIEEKEMAIPASISIAQGLLESAAGTTRLAKLANNHFSKVCHSKHCKKGHCKNIVPESHKDFYVIYQSTWESYRAHSESLYKEDRYQKLYSISKKDYKAWAKGLEKAGYSKEKNYASKLVYLIETYHLDKI